MRATLLSAALAVILAAPALADDSRTFQVYVDGKPAGQFVEQLVQVALRDDRLRDRQQGPVLPEDGTCLTVWYSITHSSRHREPPRAAKERGRAFGPGGWRPYSTSPAL